MSLLKSSLASMPCGSRESRLPLRDDVDERDGSDAQPPKQIKIGSFGERWRDRCQLSTINNDISVGCTTSRCDCASHFSAREVFEARSEMSKKTLSGSREWLRNYLTSNVNSSHPFGYDLHLIDSRDKVCMSGFELYYGYSAGYLYRIRDQLRSAVVADDPNLGGQRHALAFASDAGEVCDDHSAKYMSASGWWSEVRDDTEHQPSTRERQLDYIEKSELYREYVADQLDTGSPESVIASQVDSFVACTRLHVNLYS
jgi:hypothetical protein